MKEEMRSRHDKMGLILVVVGIAVALVFVIIISIMSGANPFTFNYPVYR